MTAATRKLLTLLLVATLSHRACSQVWTVPYYEAPPAGPPGNVLFVNHDNSRTLRISMDEEVAATPLLLATIMYKDAMAPTLVFTEGTQAQMGLVVKQLVPGDNWQLQVNNKIDYESLKLFRFELSVPGDNERGQIAVAINNLNDNKPAFDLTNSASCSVNENVAGDVDSCEFTVYDLDGVSFEGPMTLTATSPTGDFKVTTKSTTSDRVIAVVNVVSPLDYDTISLHMLTLTAKGSIEEDTSTTNLILRVRDLPDLKPFWVTPPVATFSTPEETAAELPPFTAQDGDRGINAPISYKLLDGNSDWFTVEEVSGGATLKIAALDREALGVDSITVKIQAFETNDPTQFEDASVTVILMDVNDNSPVITPDVLMATMDEGSLQLPDFGVAININDPDLATAGQYLVTLEDESESTFGWKDAFGVIPNLGYQNQQFTITVLDPLKLDYEDPNWRTIRLTLKATEVADPSHTGTAEITITLRDLNDESPVFSSDPFVATVKENVAAGTTLVTVEATDGDAEDAELTYQILTRFDAVTMDPVTGVVTINRNNAFNFEVQEEVTLQISVRDKATPAHVTYSSIVITVEDLNDERPVWQLSGEQIEVTEETVAGTEVSRTVRATDADFSANLVFSIDWDKTKATLRGITLKPEDNSLYINCLEIITEYEGGDYGDAIGVLKVGATRIDAEVFDTLYLAIVVKDTATDTGFLSENTATVTVLIINIPDEAPKFDESTLTDPKSVTENSQANTLIGYVVATDPDLLDTIEYTLSEEPGTPVGWVTINSANGELRTTSTEIDAEDPTLISQELKYKVKASDTANSTEASITISIIDSNDERPVFNNLGGPFPIEENSLTGTIITTVAATDADVSAQFKRLSYDLNPDQINFDEVNNRFSVDSTSGEVTVNLKFNYVLDRETTPSYVVGVRVRDNYPTLPGIPGGSLPNTGYFTVELIDVNDNSPIFVTPAPDISVDEDLDTDELVYAGVSAPDADENFSTVTYEITKITMVTGLPVPEPPEEPLFKLSEVNNNLVNILAGRSLRNYYGIYDIEMEACDNGVPPMCSVPRGIFRVVINDLNDNAPEFIFPPDSSYQLRLRKEQQLNNQLYDPTDLAISNILASDLDSDKNGQIDFTIEGDATSLEYFTLREISSTSAQLQLTKEFEDGMKVFDLTILATDRGDFPMSNSTTIRVFVIDTTDRPPLFDEGVSPSYTWDENDPNLSQVLPMAIDENNNNLPINEQEGVFYYLVEGDQDTFEVSELGTELTGPVLSLKKELDREDVEQHNLRVVATNNQGNPNVEDVRQNLDIIIMVRDLPDSPPSFPLPLYVGGITPSDTSNLEVIRIKATDPDNRLDDPLVYTIVDSSMQGSTPELQAVPDPFTMRTDRDTWEGVLRTNFAPQSFMKGFFTFQVKVQDLDGVGEEAFSTVKIYLVSVDNRVYFSFLNELDEVNQERDFITDVFTRNIGYACSIDDVALQDPEAGTGGNATVTIVRTHFINTEENEPVEAATILGIATNYEVVTIMRAELLARELNLIDVLGSSPVGPDNLAEILTIVLIVVSVVLGALVIILFAAFVLKTRSLNRRLAALSNTKFGSQESGLNRLGLTNVPNTNKHAVEGSNPVWNEDVPPYDSTSQGSGDSDLIGVEDNPEFGYGKNGGMGLRGSQEGGYYSGSDVQAGRDTPANYGAHMPSTDL